LSIVEGEAAGEAAEKPAIAVEEASEVVAVGISSFEDG
jgi:hypothetical protein